MATRARAKRPPAPRRVGRPPPSRARNGASKPTASNRGQPRDRPSLGEWAASNRPALVLGGMIALYIAVFVPMTWRHHQNFGTAGFDMGIYDQGLWLLSRFKEPFVTVRGLNYFGHHANYTTILLVPAYWLGAGPKFLYLAQTVVLAAGAVPIWLLARDRLEHAWLALTMPAAYLLHPAVGWITWWNFHPDALIVTPLLFAYWFATRRRWGWFAVCAVLVAFTKEDGALALGAFGVLLLLRRAWRPGLATALGGAAWFLLTTRVLIPRANGGLHPLYDELFPAYGSSLFEILGTMVRKPGMVLRDLTEGSRVLYFWQLFAPVAMAPVLALPVLLIALPQLTINALSAHSQTHDIHYHYTAIPLAVVFLATVEAFRVVLRPPLRIVLAVWVCAGAVAAHVAWAPSPVGNGDRPGVWSTPASRGVTSMRYAVELVPPGVGVSAAASVVPHLTHREHIYEWPHPFVALDGVWGVEGSKPPDPDSVDWIVVDLGDPFTYDVYPESAELFGTLTADDGPFEIVFQGEHLLVARRR